MLHRAREDGVDDTGEGTRGVILRIGEARTVICSVDCVALLKEAPGVVKSTELEGDTGANAYERCEGTFVECGGSFVFPDVSGGLDGPVELVVGLKSNFHNILMLLSLALRGLPPLDIASYQMADLDIVSDCILN